MKIRVVLLITSMFFITGFNIKDIVVTNNESIADESELINNIEDQDVNAISEAWMVKQQ